MELTEKKAQLTNWVGRQHIGQLIRGTSEPYIHHLTSVAEMAASFAEFGYEVGLCHDLFEKTEVTPAQFHQALTGFSYRHEESELIVGQVIELTDVYTKTAYPDLTKLQRKEKEAKRLQSISPDAQTVKYADLIYNIHWVKRYDPENKATYLSRKKKLLLEMNSGHITLKKCALAECNGLN